MIDTRPGTFPFLQGPSLERMIPPFPICRLLQIPILKETAADETPCYGDCRHRVLLPRPALPVPYLLARQAEGFRQSNS